ISGFGTDMGGIVVGPRKYFRDIMLGADNYRKIMSLMMEECNVDIDEFADGLWMKEKHLKDLDSKGHIIGLHSHSHPTSMASLSRKEQKKEYKLNYDILYQILNKHPETMAHPCNSYNQDTMSILKEFDIKIGFRSNMGKCPVSELEFKREDHANVMRRING
ncbi:MAG: polysaccharide deacetylase family protein, partial [Candidatus Omnitrophica bacterium]|nr:polysaccharide deacetylase family protein [Candidatus Omnitrophota bacterium]